MATTTQSVRHAALCLVLMLVALSVHSAPHVAEVRVAVAANFVPTLEAIATAFEARTGQRVVTISGSTGKLFAQIVQGAPFDVFLAADRARPAELERRHLIVPGSRFTYAIGRLALWYPDPPHASPGPAWLSGDAPVALARPSLAPYGRAAQQVLMGLGVDPPRVFGQSVGQVFALVASGNAPRGFVAVSQLIDREVTHDDYWPVPERLHAPIAQDAVLLARAANLPAAQRFTAFLASHHAHRILSRYGYRAP